MFHQDPTRKMRKLLGFCAPMAIFLNDGEIRRLLGTIILNGDESCIRPNAYILRLGPEGEFINSGKEFELGKSKKGIRVPPGQAVGLTAFETVDFRREVVRKLFPDCDLHGQISPTTDLSREGIVAPTTSVDAGYSGTLNWTITNTSSSERRFIYQEKLFRLTIFKLAPGETPESPYNGDYQGRTGYIRSQRKGAPTGMRESEWEDAALEGGPEAHLEMLIKSGFPWNMLGERFKMMDQQFKTVTNEYADIKDTMDQLTRDVSELQKGMAGLQQTVTTVVKGVLQEESLNLQNRWLIGCGTIIGLFVGAAATVIGNNRAWEFIKEHGTWVGLAIIMISVSALIFVARRPRKA